MRKTNGIIGHLGLSDWWQAEFTKGEQRYLISRFGDNLIKGSSSYGYKFPAVFLHILYSWVSTKKDYPIALKIIKKIESEHRNILTFEEQHFCLLSMIRFFYKNRDCGDNLNLVIRYCNEQIDISEDVRKFLLNKYENQSLPMHTGYEQLAILEEKRKNYLEAIKLCKQAKEQNWAGDWDKRIERCTKKMNLSS